MALGSWLLARLFAPILAAPTHGQFELWDRTDVRAGYFGFPTDPSVHAETVPTGRLLWGSRLFDLTLEYAPRLTLADLQLGLNPSVLQVGLFAAQWHTDATRLTVSEYASYGYLNYSAQLLPGTGAGTDTGRVDPLLRQKLLYAASSTSLSAVITPESRWSLGLNLSYSLSGGADDEAKSVLPFVKGPLLAASFDYGLTHGDHLISVASGERSTLSTGYDYYFLRAAERWSHEFAPRSTLTLGAGLTYVRSSSFPPDVPLAVPSPPIDGIRYNLFPTADVALQWQLPYRDKVTLRAWTGLGPVVNRATGLLSPQFQTIVSGSWLQYPWIFLGDAALSQSLWGGIDAFTYVSGQLGAGYWFTKQVDVAAGAKAAWQKIGQYSTPIVERLAFVAVTVRLPSLRF